MTISEKQDLFVKNILAITSWEEKFEFIMDKADSVPDCPDDYRSAEYLVKECQSKLWMASVWKDYKLQLHFHSATLIVRGLLGVFYEIYNNHTATEIINTDFQFIEQSELSRLFSNRSIGISAVLNRIYIEAKKEQH